MKILFYLSSRYPTEKAYGVTTGESARALRNLGHHVTICGSSLEATEKQFDSYGNLVHYFMETENSQRNLQRRKLYRALHISFNVNSFLQAILKSRIIKSEKYDLIWLRDSISAFCFSFLLRNTWFVLEIHHRPKMLQRILLRGLAFRKKVLFVAIQRSMLQELCNTLPKQRFDFCPMGVSSYFFEMGAKRTFAQEKKKSAEPVKVCFIGRLESSGIDNGIYRLLDSWAKIPETLGELTVIGLRKTEINALEKQYFARNIHLEESINHAQIPSALLNFDCGILPYPEHKYHRSRFPIKSLEYAATGLTTIATRTTGHLEILDSNSTIYYDLNDEDALVEILYYLKSDPQMFRRNAVHAREWANRYTYENRVKVVLNLIERQST